MSNDPMRIHLSLVSHTNIGKTTLARTLLGRDIGEVADRAHVTETTDDYVLARTPEGCELILWDTPGFGNSVALAKRLEGRANPVGWFLSEVWDRVANKSLWLNQKALRHVKETSSVVLYLVNATELPDSAPYVSAEMRILEWIGKPVIVLLNQMGEPNPVTYKKKKGLRYNNPNSGKNDGLWSAATIARILQNKIYTGAMVQGRHRVISYKVHKQISVPEDEWYIVPNTHEAIIDRATFEKAQALHTRDTRTSPGKKKIYLMSGFIRCSECQKAMRRKTARNIGYYSCRSYTDKRICSKHTIRQDKLENAVLAALQMQIALVDHLADEIKHIKNEPVTDRERKLLSHSLKQAENQQKQYNDASDSLYLDWKSGEITKDEYRRLKGKIAEQIQQIQANVSYLKEELQIISDGIGIDDPYLTVFLTCQNIQSLNRGILAELINAIWVHENGEITIDFNFADEYQRIVDQMENDHNVIT